MNNKQYHAYMQSRMSNACMNNESIDRSIGRSVGQLVWQNKFL